MALTFLVRLSSAGVNLHKESTKDHFFVFFVFGVDGVELHAVVVVLKSMLACESGGEYGQVILKASYGEVSYIIFTCEQEKYLLFETRKLFLVMILSSS